MRQDSITMIIGAVISFILQIIIAPNIAIFSVAPNFLLVYVLVLAILRPRNNSTMIVAFIFGLFYDLLGHGPVGAMTFLMVLAVFATSRLFMFLNNNAFSMAAITLVVAILLVESLYALFLLMFGFSAGLVEAFLYRSLPSALYDCVFALIFYPVASKFFVDVPRAQASDAPHASIGPTGSASKLSEGPKKKKPRF